jgi:ankyrin repeat protein
VDAKDSDGCTALYRACQHSICDNAYELQIIKMLLVEGKADPNLRHERTGNTLLGCVCVYGRAKIAQQLLANGANPDAYEADGRSPLMLACSKFEDVQRKSSHLTIVKMLLHSRADPNALAQSPSQQPEASTTSEKAPEMLGSWKGATALHVASCFGYTDCVKLLISAGCDPSIRLSASSPDDDPAVRPFGTAAQVAEDEGHTELATEIRRLVAVQRKKQKNKARKQRKEERDKQERLRLLAAQSVASLQDGGQDPELDELVESAAALSEGGDGESETKAEGSRPDSPPVSPVGDGE